MQIYLPSVGNLGQSLLLCFTYLSSQFCFLLVLSHKVIDAVTFLKVLSSCTSCCSATSQHLHIHLSVAPALNCILMWPGDNVLKIEPELLYVHCMQYDAIGSLADKKTADTTEYFSQWISLRLEVLYIVHVPGSICHIRINFRSRFHRFISCILILILSELHAQCI